MKVTLKRLLSVLLVLCMMLSVLPVSALAAMEPNEAYYNANQEFGYDSFTSGGGSNVDSGVKSVKVGSTTLTRGDTSSVTTGDAYTNGVDIEFKSGWYLTRWKIVCGDKYSCQTDRDGNAIKASDVMAGATSAYYHVSVSKLALGHSSKKDPYWLLIELAQDTTLYPVTYNWGILEGHLASTVPEGGNYLVNTVVTVASPSDAALAEAAELGYEFVGWEKSYSVSEDEAVVESVKSGSTFPMPRASVTLTAKWKELPASFTVTKKWEDDGNRDGLRPKSISVQLYQDEKEYGNPIELTGPDWSYTWNDLPKYQSVGGAPYKYTVDEVAVPNGYARTSVEGGVITNTHTPETIAEITVTKEWDDADNQDAKRPESVDVQLCANGVPLEDTKVTLSADNKWSHTWENLPKNENGAAITYTVEEVEDTVPEGYTPTCTGNVTDGFTVTNTHIPETFEKITVTKEWEDNKNQDGKRPTSVEVQLYADNEPVEGTKATLNAENNWTYAWKNLDKYKAGKEIVYSVQEVTVPGYSAEVTGSVKDGFTVTNTHTPETIEKITVTKEWVDNNNQDNKQPAFVEVQLYANDEPVDSGIVTLNETNGWSSGWEKVPKYEDGVEISYKVVELTKVEGYTTEITGDVENGFIVKNSHTPETITISGEKTWKDDEKVTLDSSPRPDSIIVRLLGVDGVEVASKEVRANEETGEWTYSFEGLPKYNNGSVIEYQISEDPVGGYRTSYEGYNIVNTYAPGEITITVTKGWDDGDNQDCIRPDHVEVQLMGNGKPVGESVVLNADNEWRYTFNVDKQYRGKDIDYTVKEINVPAGYTPRINGFAITNVHVPEVTSVSVQKVWNDENDLAGFRPESIQVQLYKIVNGQLSPCGDPVTLNEDGRWKYEWTDLPVMEAGQRISYSVGEVEVPVHYDAATSIGAGNVFVLTNTHAPEKTNITVTKTWDDGNDRDGLRPSSVKVTLYRNGTKVKTVTLSEKNDWTYVFTDMQVYADGEKANYTVTETKVDNYQPKVTYTENPNTGLAIELVNSYTPEQTSVTVTKKWTDSSNKAGDRSASVTIYLLANGEKTGDELVLNSANKWTGSFDNLPVKKDGKTIKYTISEKAVANYTAKITGSAAKGFVVTNTHTSIPVTGDESNLVLYAVLFAIGAAAAVSALILSKKKFGRRR